MMKQKAIEILQKVLEDHIAAQNRPLVARLCIEALEEGLMVSKTYSDYEPRSKSSEMCKDCTMFRTPDKCTYVDGQISPEGWCKFFEPKKEAA